MSQLLQETTYIMKKNHINANKSLGQNFLIDDDILNTIVTSSQITREDLVIEIGPGLGNLTKSLLEKAGKVICIELDPRMINILKQRFITYHNFILLNEDILKLDLNSLIEMEKSKYKSIKVVANLPYYITTPILMRFLEEKIQVNSITVMVQKEVAQRLTAIPGSDYSGAITYTIHYYTIPQIIVDVPKDSFLPIPEVDSSVIQLTKLETPSILVANENLFFSTIKQAFMQRRKTLVNALTNFHGLSKETLEQILEDISLDIKIRGEKLSLHQFKQLAEAIENKLSIN